MVNFISIYWYIDVYHPSLVYVHVCLSVFAICMCVCVCEHVCMYAHCVHATRVSVCMYTKIYTVCIGIYTHTYRREVRDTLQAMPHHSDVRCGGSVRQRLPPRSQHQLPCNPPESSTSLKSLFVSTLISSPPQPMLHRKFRKERQPKSAPLACSMLG